MIFIIVNTNPNPRCNLIPTVYEEASVRKNLFGKWSAAAIFHPFWN